MFTPKDPPPPFEPLPTCVTKVSNSEAFDLTQDASILAVSGPDTRSQCPEQWGRCRCGCGCLYGDNLPEEVITREEKQNFIYKIPIDVQDSKSVDNWLQDGGYLSVTGKDATTELRVPPQCWLYDYLWKMDPRPNGPHSLVVPALANRQIDISVSNLCVCMSPDSCSCLEADTSQGVVPDCCGCSYCGFFDPGSYCCCSDCRECPKGYCCPGNCFKYLCPVGTYSSEAGGAVCTPCEDDLYRYDMQGASSVEECDSWKCRDRDDLASTHLSVGSCKAACSPFLGGEGGCAERGVTGMLLQLCPFSCNCCADAPSEPACPAEQLKH